MDLKLYKIADNYLEAINALDIDGDPTNNILDNITGSFEKKAENVASCYKNMSAEIDAMKQYEKNMEERRKKLERKREYLKKYLLTNMQKCNKIKIKTTEHSLTIRQNPPKVVADIDLIPDDYISIDVAKKLDKIKIKKAIESGETIEGAYLQQEKTLTIK